MLRSEFSSRKWCLEEVEINQEQPCTVLVNAKHGEKCVNLEPEDMLSIAKINLVWLKPKREKM